jgi:hypothetical protein
MLELDVVLAEDYDEETKKFIPAEQYRVELEHSLVSVSKWESFWETPFLGNDKKTTEQTVSYVRMMILGDQPPPFVFQRLLENHLGEIENYIGAKMTATTVPEGPKKNGRPEIITAELIYFWMISMNIPVEFQYWHLNRLIMLTRVITIKNTKAPKMSNEERRALNRQRLSKYNTTG